MSLPHHQANELADRFIANGWRQVSAKHRLLAKLPEGETGLQAMHRLDPQWREGRFKANEHESARHYLRFFAEREGNTQQVDLRTLRAFKARGGKVA